MTESYSPMYVCYFPPNEDKDMTKYKGMTVETEHEKNVTPIPLSKIDNSARVDCPTGIHKRIRMKTSNHADSFIR